jgi:hypothetical protein
VTATDPSSSAPSARSPRPRLRVAAVVWGLIVAALAAGVGWFAIDPARVTAVGLRALSAAPADGAILLVALLLAVGVVIVIGSLLSVVHRAQDRARARREERAAAPAAPTPPAAD